MAKYKVTGVPSQTVPDVTLNHTLGPVDRDIANVEAEKGETVVTNMSRGLDNIYEMYSIGGKKHYDGGTPLNLPTDGDKETDGTSFIFSDNKKMIVKDPAILEYFGVDPKKPKTYADISKTWLDAVNKSKQIIKDTVSDKISKKSAEMSMDNAAFKIAALKLKQEAHKGMKDGVPNGMTPFFDKLQIDPTQMFAMNDEDTNKADEAVKSAFGGSISKPSDFKFDFKEAPSLTNSFRDGGDLNKFAFGDEVSVATTTPTATPVEPSALKWGTVTPTAQKQYNYIVNILGKDEDFKEALFEEYKKEAAKPDNFGKGYNDQFKKDKKFINNVVRKTKEEVYQDYVDFQRRNLMLQSHGKKVDITDQDPIKGQISNKDVTAWTNELGVPLPSKMDDATAEQLSYIAFEKLSKNRDQYSDKLKKVLKPFGATQHGKGDELIAGSTERGTISKADGAYTNTTAGQISYYTEPEPEEKEKIEKEVENRNPPQSKPPVYGHLNPVTPLQNPYGFRREDINSLQRAVQARYEIPELHPWAKFNQVVMPDRAYYSPERAIAAKNEQLNIAQQNQNVFGNAQSAGANAMAMSGQAYGDVANTISDYADKNVGIFNAGEQYNTQLANQASLQNSQIATDLWDKENTLKQNLANSISAAKDKITQLSNQAYTNASNIYNLNTTNENFKKDPFTGLITKVNDRAITPTQDNSKSFGVEFNDFAQSMPNVNPDLQMKAFLAMKSGKYVIEKDDEVTKPTELTNQNTWS